MFESTGGRGFRIRFPNGLIVSVQWGYCLHCENYNNRTIGDKANSTIASQFYCSSKDAEVAVIDNSTGELVTEKFMPDAYDIKGYCSPMEVADLIHRVSIATEG